MPMDNLIKATAHRRRRGRPPQQQQQQQQQQVHEAATRKAGGAGTSAKRRQGEGHARPDAHTESAASTSESAASTSGTKRAKSKQQPHAHQQGGHKGAQQKSATPQLAPGLRASSSHEVTSKRLRIVSWNINGLTDTKEMLPDRYSCMCQELRELKPDIVLLQEVENEHGPLLCQLMASIGLEGCDSAPTLGAFGGYGLGSIGDDEPAPYFTSTFIRDSSLLLVKQTRTPFPGTRMVRDLNAVDLRCKRSHRQLWVGNVHLESLKTSGAERCKQLTTALQALERRGIGLVAGDTNLRETEAKRVVGQHQKQHPRSTIADAWELAGSVRDTRFTWDTQINDTLDTSQWKFKPRARYDRCYVKGLQVADFRLLGTTPKDPAVGFVSDHFGICIDVDWPPTQDKSSSTSPDLLREEKRDQEEEEEEGVVEIPDDDDNDERQE